MGRVILYIFCLVGFLSAGMEQPESMICNDFPQSCVIASSVIPENTAVAQNSSISQIAFIPSLITDFRYYTTENRISYPGKYVRYQFFISNELQDIPVYTFGYRNTEYSTVSHPCSFIYYLRKLLI